MATLGVLKARVADELTRPELATQIAYAIEDVVLLEDLKPWWFLEDSGTVTTVAGTAAYDMPTDFRQMRVATITDGDQDYILTPLDYGVYQSWATNVANVQTRPNWYSLYAKQISFYPTPGTTYTANLFYTKALSVPATDDDSNELTTDLEPLVRTLVKREIHLQVTRNYEAAAAMQRWIDVNRPAFISRSTKQSGGPGVTPWM